MKNIPITSTLPEEIVRELQVLEKGLQEKKERLSREFRQAANDTERNAEIELWDSLI